jgi:YidC/Oxa1 family membrane protein insertase
MDEALLPAGDVLERAQSLYVGPKKYAELKALGLRRDGVMELGKMGWAGRPLLNTLNAIYRVVPNYGVAIIVLTLLVRILFWPVTHKSTESMRKMSALQPQIKALQAKFKDNPQRMQQETMKLYKENKVNPLGGCVPMLVQIPVFIALFTVLRSAVELRFAPFLWISDLSEPENLLAGMIPVIGSLNILPLLMVATMFIQQKLTPAAGDPQQQKMMAIMMPLMMLIFFYTMPSGLVLYWTTSQVSMIVQLLVRKEREKRAKA